MTALSSSPRSLAKGAVLFAVIASSLVGGEAIAQGVAKAESPAGGTASADVRPNHPVANSAIKPKPLDWHHWRQRHKKLADAAAGPSPRLLFLGDSITENWAHAGSTVWDEALAPMGAANFGIAGDRTQSLRWRIRKGGYDQMDPEFVVLLIGTNNLKNSRNTPKETVAGILAVANDCLSAFEGAEILLLSLLPCMEDPNEPHATGVVAVNETLKTIEFDSRIRHLDVGDRFLDASGQVSSEVLPDYLHPNEEGYRNLAEALQRAEGRWEQLR